MNALLHISENIFWEQSSDDNSDDGTMDGTWMVKGRGKHRYRTKNTLCIRGDASDCSYIADMTAISQCTTPSICQPDDDFNTDVSDIHLRFENSWFENQPNLNEKYCQRCEVSIQILHNYELSNAQ